MNARRSESAAASSNAGGENSTLNTSATPMKNSNSIYGNTSSAFSCNNNNNIRAFVNDFGKRKRVEDIMFGGTEDACSK